MNDPRVASALRQLEELKRDYRQRSVELIAALAERVARSDASVLPDAESELHKLAGSGGSFGFPELSQSARTLELAIRSHRQSGAEASSFDLAALSMQIAQLGAHLGADEQAAIAPAVALGSHTNSEGPVYLLESNAEEAQRIAATLVQFGLVVESFEHPDQLIRAIGRQSPFAILVDLSIGIDGKPLGAERIFEAVEQARAAFGLSGVAIYFISHQDTMALRLGAARAQAHGFFVRPVDPMQVIDRLDMQRSRLVAPGYRVLLIDDDRTLAGHHAAVLQAGGFEVEVVNDPKLALERMDAFRPDLLLLDMYMPDCSGPELARVIRMHGDWIATPIVFLSAETDMQLQLDAASEGADDFLTKPIRDAHLVAALRTRCERAQQMAALINRDSLTGLLKHSRIKEELLGEVGRAQRQQQPLSVVMLDIDFFKRVNDTFGHPTGDQVIRALASLLRQRVRTTDRVGRYGGEEFMLVLPNCNAEAARSLVLDICQRFKSLRFESKGQEFSVTLSAGVASLDSNGTAAELTARADDALYRAKHGGRDQVVVASSATSDID